MDKLTLKQQVFIDEYLVDLNATQAAIRAGYSEKTAKEIGAENLTKLNIQNAIAAAMEERSVSTKITAEKVLQGILDVTEAAQGEGNHNAALRGYELLGKHIGLFVDKASIEVSGKDGAALSSPILDLSHLSIDSLTILAKMIFNKEDKSIDQS